MWLFSLLQKYSPNHSTAVSITCWRERWQFSRWINEDLAMQLYLLNTQILDSNRTQIKLASATFNKYVKKNTKHICEISYIKNTFRSSHCGTVGSAAFWECWDTDSIPGPAQWVKDPVSPQMQLGSDPWPGSSICQATAINKKYFHKHAKRLP